MKKLLGIMLLSLVILTACGGVVYHTPNDNVSFIKENFPSRIEEH